MNKRIMTILVVGLLIIFLVPVLSYGVENGQKKAIITYLTEGSFNLSTVLGTNVKSREIDLAELKMDQLKACVGQWKVLKNEKSTQDGEFRAEKINGKTKVIFKGVYHSYLGIDKSAETPDFCAIEISGLTELQGKTKEQLIAYFGKGFNYRKEKGDSQGGLLPAIIIVGEDPNKRVIFYLDKKGKTTGTFELKVLADW